MILISGEALIDLIPDPDKDGRYDAVLGGSPYNVAIGLGRLGAPTAFVSRISADANGEGLAAALARDGVDLSFVARDPQADAARLRHARHRADGIALFLLSRRDRVRRPLAVPGRLARRAPDICMSARSPPSIRATARASSRRCALARELATTSYDPNIRPLVTPDRESVVALVERQVSLCQRRQGERRGSASGSIPAAPIEDTLSQWARLGPSFCVATLGDRGAVAFLGGLRTSVAAPKVDVVDTVGAGDSFMSALLAAMDRDGALGAGAPKPSLERLEAWLAFAAAASAITCTRKGSNPPTLAEVREYQAI